LKTNSTEEPRYKLTYLFSVVLSLSVRTYLLHRLTNQRQLQ